VVGAQGILKDIEVSLSAAERTALQRSAKKLAAAEASLS
jgi:malate/lactate dehydrogenase